MADHSQDLVGKEGHKLTLPEGRGEELHKPTHAIREETLGKAGLKEHKADAKAALEEHREVSLWGVNVLINSVIRFAPYYMLARASFCPLLVR